MPKLEAKVKDSYAMGPIVAFSGREYVRSEWRPVPAGFEPAAIAHPLLDVREVEGKEIKVTSKDYLAEIPETTETAPEEEESKPKKSSRRSRKEE